jgi:hypothetical protein
MQEQSVPISFRAKGEKIVQHCPLKYVFPFLSKQPLRKINLHSNAYRHNF